jgi:hypothetical protein
MGCHWHLSKYLETDANDRPAPIIILKISTLPIMDVADNGTLSGLIQQVGHDTVPEN